MQEPSKSEEPLVGRGLSSKLELVMWHTHDTLIALSHGNEDKTLIDDWADLAAICELCPHLEWLSLSRTFELQCLEASR